MVLGIIGLGVVGSIYACGLAEKGQEVLGYDVCIGQPFFAGKEKLCKEAGVELVSGLPELVCRADWVLAVTTCAHAEDLARDAAVLLRPGQLYADLSSSIPAAKLRMRDIVEASGADFVDACSMGSPLGYGLRNEVAVSGPRAREMAYGLNSRGMNLTIKGPEVGQAAAFKVLRSIYTKGLEAILVECLSTAYAFGIFDQVFSSICHMMTEDVDALYSRMVRTNVVQSMNRAEEIGDVTGMLRERHLNSIMADAAYRKLLWSANCGIKEHFHSATPEHLEEPLAYWASLLSAGQTPE
ncbi:MAG: NAD(P)-dependent oxidoreductase [Lachnospiraceae bacterium]|nr:NAD(P)-dependent oxidoreductase [Lachnospiraceae bacterium]